MSMPRFTAEASFRQATGRRAGAPGPRAAAGASAVSPQATPTQARDCALSWGSIKSVAGPCTNRFATHTSSVSIASGYTQWCTWPFSYPWIEYCDLGVGSWVTAVGCGFCVW
ncbi:MAG TPA: hypothetical protein VFL91_24080 [Thermomicrobiales bacterium]|nr:hypothetical protein [Thermomicrobiales bacterium]